MRIVGISGSPRAKGNTDILVQEALKAASGAFIVSSIITVPAIIASALRGKENKEEFI